MYKLQSIHLLMNQQFAPTSASTAISRLILYISTDYITSVHIRLTFVCQCYQMIVNKSPEVGMDFAHLQIECGLLMNYSVIVRALWFVLLMKFSDSFYTYFKSMFYGKPANSKRNLI